MKSTLAVDPASTERLKALHALGDHELLRPRWAVDRWTLILGFWSVPISIAVSESFLSLALGVRILRFIRGQVRVQLPMCFWFWLVWAGSAFVVWTQSPEPGLGWSEIRHMLLIAVVFFVLPALRGTSDRLTVWKGILVTSAVSSLFLIGEFVWRAFYYHREISAGGDVGFYLRSGGLLHHWMVYGTVEILVVAGLLSFWTVYREERQRWWPVFAITVAAIVLSLTRMMWLTCLLMLLINLIWKRSRWLWALPLLPFAIYVLAPTAVRLRAVKSIDPAYYSNSERLQMLRVGWQMVRDHPLTGVGPGRIDKLYTSYLASQDPIPAYHGHLHNNVAQIAAQFGIPVTLTAFLFVAVLFRDLLKARKTASTRDDQFLVQTAILALTGFVFAGLFEYTYGHSLALILLCFAVLPILFPVAPEHPKLQADVGD
ncbi:MAG TPA: O-antigen ligase family protein [Terriglobia bacterium]|nr:O-antigen ligase family protein [Terriglobia bacterium]